MSSQTPQNTLYTTQIFPQEYGQFLNVIQDIYSKIANTVNQNEFAFYPLLEILTNRKVFSGDNNALNYRAGFRIVVQSVVATGANAIPHNITPANTIFLMLEHSVYLYPPGSPPAQFIAVPNGGASSIELIIDQTNVQINNVPAMYNGYNALIILDYLKNT